jgi:hypothetical protein
MREASGPRQIPVAERAAGKLATPIVVLLLLAISIVASAAAPRGERAECYEPCAARCVSRYACEQRHAGPNCFTNLNKCKSFCWRICRHQSMIPKSVQRFSEKIMLKQEAKAGWQSHPALE